MQLHATFVLFRTILIYATPWPVQNFGEKDPLLKIFKIQNFSEVWELLPADFDHKAKQKQLDTQVNVTLL